MLKFFRRLFCKHEWEKEIINGGFWWLTDGLFARPGIGAESAAKLSRKLKRH